MRAAGLSVELLVALVLVAAPVRAATVRFPEDGYSLQLLLNGLSQGDTVLVQPGQWSVQNVSLKSGITLMAENGSASSTVLHAFGADSVLTALSDTDVVLEDLTLTGAERALVCQGSEIVADRVVFRDNGRAPSGAGLYCTSSDVELSGCLFEANVVGDIDYTHTTTLYTGSGGGIMASGGSSLTAYDVTFDSNLTWYTGAGVCLSGEGTTAYLSGCTFVDNETSTHIGTEGAQQCGAALSVYRGAAAVLDEVWFLDNWSNADGGAVWVGETPGYISQVELHRCVFTGNHANDRAVSVGVTESSYAELVNCTFAETVVVIESVYFGPGCSGAISNCVLGSGSLTCSGGVLVSKCCGPSVHQMCGQTDSVLGDPFFCSPASRDFSLCADSPCLPWNNVWGELIGALGEGCEACGTAVLEQSWGAIKAMYRTD